MTTKVKVNADLMDIGEALAKQASKVGEIVNLGGRPFTYILSGGELEPKSVEEYLPHPSAKRGQTTFHELASFSQFVAVHQAENSVLYANPDNHKVHCVFDDHSASAPGWQEFKACLALSFSEEFKTWANACAVPLTIRKFRDLIDAQRSDFASGSSVVLDGSANPGVTDLLQMLTHVATYDESKTSETSRSTNTKFEREERNGVLIDPEFPEKLLLGIPIFRFAMPYAVVIRIRFIADNGQVMVRLSMDRRELLEFRAFRDVVAILRNANADGEYETDQKFEKIKCPIYIGAN